MPQSGNKLECSRSSRKVRVGEPEDVTSGRGAEAPFEALGRSWDFILREIGNHGKVLRIEVM